MWVFGRCGVVGFGKGVWEGGEREEKGGLVGLWRWIELKRGCCGVCEVGVLSLGL